MSPVDGVAKSRLPVKTGDVRQLLIGIGLALVKVIFEVRARG